MGAVKWGHKATLCNLCTIVYNCAHLWPFGPLFKGNFRCKMTPIVGNRGQLWTSTLSPLFAKPQFRLSRCFEAQTNRKEFPQREANLAIFHRKTHRNRNCVVSGKRSPPRLWRSLWAPLAAIQCRWPYNEILNKTLRPILTVHTNRRLRPQIIARRLCT